MLLKDYFIVMNVRFICGILIGVITCLGCTSKKGCTDPASTNYEAEAKIDDGACKYPNRSLVPLKLSKLDNIFRENSGLEFVNDQLWTLVDGGGENNIYSLNFGTGDWLEQIDIQGATNVDYEALTASSSHFYIADIGNNDGEREDLVIYKFSHPQAVGQYITATPERIEFSYPEQQGFEKDPMTNFDAEAIFFHTDNLYVFTKQHGNKHTVIYEIPSIPGQHDAVAKGELNVEMLVTDADINNKGNKVVLVGNDGSQVFLWLLMDFPGDKFFNGKKIKINIGSMESVGQVEGVAFNDDNSVFLSSENHPSVDQNLYYLDLSGIE